MNYFVKRGDQQYGPYTLAALQQYVAQGNISRNDLARSEGMTEWVAVSTIIGNVAVSAPAAFGAPATPTISQGNLPSGLHWAWVVVLGIVTIGIFWAIWLIVEAAWIRKVRPQSKSLFYILLYLGAAFAGGFLDASGSKDIALVLRLASMVLGLVGIFTLRSELEDYFSPISPGFTLSGVMTFFFNAAYFQYHLRQQRELAMRHAGAAMGVGA